MHNTFLFLNSLGTGEFILIALVFLLFFGAKNIPETARMMGRGMRQLKDATNDIKREINQSTGDVGNIGKELKEDLDEATKDIQKVNEQVKQTIRKADNIIPRK